MSHIVAIMNVLILNAKGIIVMHQKTNTYGLVILKDASIGKIRTINFTKEGVDLLTYEEAKKELSEYRDNIRYIEEKQNDALELRTRLEATTKTLSDMPSGKGQKEKYQLEEYIDRMKAIEKECNEKLQELLIKKFIVEAKIEKLDQPYKTIIYLRYIRGIRTNDMKLGYTERHARRLLKEGINFYAKL